MKSKAIINMIMIGIPIALLVGCCKKEVSYNLSDYEKSWFSSYQGSTVIFKNQFDSAVTYSYSIPQLSNIERFNSEGGCSKVPFTIQNSTMELTSSKLPVSFQLFLNPYYKDDNGSHSENLFITFNGPYNYPFILNFDNDTIAGSYTYHESVVISNSTFDQVYQDSNYSTQIDPYKVLSFYLTKKQGVVAFRTDSAIWTLQN